MHANLVIPVVQGPEGKSVVEILRILRVNGESQCIPEVLPALQILRGNLLRDLIGRILHLRGESVRQCVFGEDCVHLGIILSRRSKHIHDMSCRLRFASLPAVHHGGHLHSGTDSHLPALSVHGLEEPGHGVFLAAGLPEETGLRIGTLALHVYFSLRVSHVNAYVVWHCPALHQHPGLSSHDLENSDEWPRRPLQYLFDNALAPLGLRFLLRHGYPDLVPVQGASGLVHPNEDIVAFLHLHENILVPHHLHDADDFCYLLVAVLFSALSENIAARTFGIGMPLSAVASFASSSVCHCQFEC